MARAVPCDVFRNHHLQDVLMRTHDGKSNAAISADYFLSYLQNTSRLIATMRDNASLRTAVDQAVSAYLECFGRGGKLLFAGNGGSAADAQHMAAEYTSRFRFDRPALPALALTTDSSVLTSVGNDYGFEELFSRQIQALARRDDLFIAYSTSGASPNIIRGLSEARRLGLKCIGFTGNRGGPMVRECDIVIEVPSAITAEIQEGHLVLGHLICRTVEDALFGNELT
jgi:D-sedoheptulose 7-phosphate isomerase